MSCTRVVVGNRSDCGVLRSRGRGCLPVHSLTRPLWTPASSSGVGDALLDPSFAFGSCRVSAARSVTF